MVVTNSNSSEVQKLSFFHEFFWGLIGLFLTIFGTLIEVFVVIPDFDVNIQHWGLQPMSLGIKYQLVGIFLTGCMAGKNAGAYAQIAYVILGLFKLPVFSQGGSFEYIDYPTFGYILGFIPGAWLCGYLVLPGKRSLELFAKSSFVGLLIIHICGIVYLVGYSLITPLFGNQLADNYLLEGITHYSLTPFPAQLALICVVSVLAFILRLILMY